MNKKKEESTGNKLLWVLFIIGTVVGLIWLANEITANDNPWHGWDELGTSLVCLIVVYGVYKVFHLKKSRRPR